MSQEPTDAELAGWARGFVVFLENCNALQDRFIPSPDAIANMRAIAARLERPAVEGVATYCGDRLVSISIDRRDGDDSRTMTAVPVTVTITPA